MKILALGDPHCGHRVGLTPPGFDAPDSHKHYYPFRRMVWDWFGSTIDKIGPVDLALWNGDLIDGEGSKSGGSEHLDTSPEEQVEMAVACCRRVEARDHLFTFGTAYHTGKSADYERQVADRIGGPIADTQHFQCNGVNFNARHHVGNSQVPYGRGTAQYREAIWNALNAAAGLEPRAQVLLRSHVHYHVAVQDAQRLTMTLPCLQGPGSKFGRRCTGEVTMGMVLFEVAPDSRWSWQLYHLNLVHVAPQVLVFGDSATTETSS